jgi:large subunit ribosomal protein L1
MATKKKVDEEKIEDETKVELEEAQEDLAETEAVDTQEAETESEEAAETEDETEEAKAEKVTKAGKHSAKAQREAEEEAARLEAKEHRAETQAEADAAPKKPKRQMPNPLHQHGKNYRKAAELVEKGKAYSLDEALDLARKTATVKFDSSVEMHINLGVDPRQADQMVRASVILPHGTGKTIRVAVYADGKAADDAKTAGADIVGTTELIAQIEKGKTDFDMLIATPAGMATLGKVAKILGPRGLMPNPKSGSVTPDPAKAVKEAKAGKVEFRIDKQAIIHQAIGKVSFSPENLRENAVAFLSAVMKAKPAAAKGTYVKAMAATTSMGPGIKVDSTATISAISTSKK